MRIIVLFNLKPSVSVADYGAWAQATDIPTVRGLTSIAGFEVFAATGLLGSEDPPPYSYIEIIDVADSDAFGVEVKAPAMQRVAAEFQALADNPLFLVTRNIEVQA